MVKKSKRYFDPEPSAEPQGPETSERNVEESQETRKSFPKKGRNKAEESTVDEEQVKKYKWSDDIQEKGVKTDFYKAKYIKKQARIDNSARQAARSELLLNDEAGFLEADVGENTYEFLQQDIAASVDITSATKYFELDLPQFGPYKISYTRNGRHLLLGGKRGHVAALDWQSKRLHCENNVMESVRDVQWLHAETMFAVAQKKWTYIYDRQGVELHCLKMLHDVKRLEFLPYHFLLVASTGTSFLHWLDVTMGKIVQTTPTREGPLDVMCQNPANAIIHCGHPKGSVSLWSPNIKEPVVKILAHSGPVRGVTVDPTGHYMATTGLDRQIRIWDIRQFKPLNSWKMASVGLGPITFSQRGLLAAAAGTTTQLFRNVTHGEVKAPYLVHDSHHTVVDLKFCPFEDVLGIGHQAGFNSILVPGAGEANIDALEANPYQSKKQRREWEVKALLDKIQPEMINIDTSLIAELDRETLQEHLDEKAKILYVKPEKIDFKPKKKAKGKSSAGKREQRKQIVKEQIRNDLKERRKLVKEELFGEDKQKSSSGEGFILDIFRTKK